MLFVCRANGGRKPSLLGYPAHSLVTMSTELFHVTLFDTNIDIFSLKSVVVEGFQKRTLTISDCKFLWLISQWYMGVNPELIARFPISTGP